MPDYNEPITFNYEEREPPFSGCNCRECTEIRQRQQSREREQAAFNVARNTDPAPRIALRNLMPANAALESIRADIVARQARTSLRSMWEPIPTREELNILDISSTPKKHKKKKSVIDDRPPFKIADSNLRSKARDSELLSLEKYSIAKMGVLEAKRPIDYNRIIRQYPLGTPLFGVELEVERATEKDALQQPLDLLGKGHLCYDGSLRNSGVEIVLQPRSQREIQDSYGSIRLALVQMSKMGLHSHNSETCGLHVHVSRDFLPDDSWLTLKTFLRDYQRIFKKLSRRTDYQYCNFDISSRENRYQALNLQPKHTAEFRFFRGTLNPESYFAALECVFSLVNYMKFIKRNKPTIRGYRAFIKAGRFHYLQAALAKLFPRRGTREYIRHSEERKTLRAKQYLYRRETRKQSLIYGLGLRVRRELTSTLYTLEVRLGSARVTLVRVPIRLRGRWPKRYREIESELTVELQIPNYNPYNIYEVIAFKSSGWGKSIFKVDLYSTVSNRNSSNSELSRDAFPLA